jgi:NitT/TauT family transport system substrate-binding protein
MTMFCFLFRFLISLCVAFSGICFFQTVLAEELPGMRSQPVTIAVSLTPLSAPVIIAHKQRFFIKRGVPATLKGIHGGHRSAKTLLSGETDMATASEAVVMFNSFEDAPLSIVATFVTSDNDVKIVTRKDTGIKNIAGLMGKRVGMMRGASSHYFLDESLILNGLDPAGVTLVDIKPEESMDRIARGEVDAVAIWEPWAYKTIQSLGKSQAVVLPHDHLYIETFNLLTTRAFARAHEETLIRMLQALNDAVQFIKTHKAEAQQIVARYLGQDLTEITAIWDDFVFELTLHQWLLTTMESEAQWAIERKLTKDTKIPNYLEFLNAGPLHKMIPEAVTVF